MNWALFRDGDEMGFLVSTRVSSQILGWVFRLALEGYIPQDSWPLCQFFSICYLFKGKMLKKKKKQIAQCDLPFCLIVGI